MNETGCRPLTTSECEKVMAAFCGRYRMRNRALFLLGVKSGFRISELLSIHVRDVWNGMQIRPSVTVAWAWMKGKKQSRTVPINPRAADAIREWLAASKMDHPFFADWPLFPAQGRPKAITSRQAFSIIVDGVSAAGISTDRIGTHSCRKSYASALWTHPAVDKDMAKMAKLLGHKNFSNTLRYLEFLDGSLNTAVMEI
jgi:integrase